MLVLGIESSCDETAFALVEKGNKTISACVSSQIDTHKPFGGVVPELAARSHLQASIPIFHKLWNTAKEQGHMLCKDVDLIAVTNGPGLMGSLIVGSEIAKGLALALRVPIIGVNHVLAHVHGVFFSKPNPQFPALSFVVSGGHTHLFYLTSPSSFTLIAQTIDDACGECFDKVAHMLNLPYPGGPHIEELAQSGDPDRFPMPKMMKEKTRLELSYSGLKTYVYNLLRKLEATDSIDTQTYADIAAAFQKEAFSQILRKLRSALEHYPKTQAIYISGGVACNKSLRHMMHEEFSDAIPAFFPPPSLCTDNAQMIAALGYHQATELLKSMTWEELYAASFRWEPTARLSQCSSYKTL